MNRLCGALAITLAAAVSGCTTDGISLFGENSADRLGKAGDNAVRRGDLAAATIFYRQADAADPNRDTSLRSLAATLHRLGAFGEAADTWKAVLERKPGDADALVGRGRALLGLGRVEEAESQFSAALSGSPGHAGALAGLGVTHDLAGRHDDARKSYRAALETRPDDPAILNNLALSMAFAGDLEGAARILRPLSERPEATARQRANLALVHVLAGDTDAGLKVLQKDNDEAESRRIIQVFESLRALKDGDLARALFEIDRAGVAAPAS